MDSKTDIISSSTSSITTTSAPPKGFVYTYVCGRCGSDVPMKRNDPIQCKECGYRILYKRRNRPCVYCAV